MTLLNFKTRANRKIAKAFVEARRSDGCVETYPGKMPKNLSEAYAIQNEAIEFWDRRVVGWKAGGIASPWSEKLGVDRLIGPVFEENCWVDDQSERNVPVFKSGFAAFEGEVTARLGEVPKGKVEFSTQDAIDLITSLHVGVEIASSPFAQINDYGPLVTISDFGNNNGLIIGDELMNWRETQVEDWVFETWINGVSVGKSAPTGMRGGPVESVRYVLENTAKRGFHMQAGDLVLTGAVTGVHRGYVGDHATLSCLGAPAIRCRLIEYP